MATLHYIYDPLCGWCYGAAPLLAAAATIPGLEIQLHGGGMLAGQHGTPALRTFVAQHVHRIEQMTGQRFGPAYLDGLLSNSAVVLDSAPPTTAVLAAGSLGLAMLQQIQKAQFQEGRDVMAAETLLALAQDLDLPDFPASFEAAVGATAGHIAESRKLLSKTGGQGFPTFYLSMSDGAGERLEHGPFLGNPERWRHHVELSLGKA